MGAFGQPTRELSILGFGETHQGWTLGFASLWRIETHQGLTLGLTSLWRSETHQGRILGLTNLWRNETHQGRTLGFVSLWRTNQGIICPGFWRNSPRADLRFCEPLENQPGNYPSWVLEILTKGGPWVLRAFGLINDPSVLGFGETLQGCTFGFTSLWRSENHQGRTLGLLSLWRCD